MKFHGAGFGRRSYLESWHMTWLGRFCSRFLALFRKSRLEDELSAELQSHLEALTDENIRRGMSPVEARYAARRDFGGVEQTRELYRERRGLLWIDNCLQDVRFAFRMLAKRPGFTFVAVLTLALGIGANTAIFTVVHSVLLQQLPFPKADRLAIVWSILGNEGRAPASGPELVAIREQSHLFEDLGGIWAQSGALTGEGEPEQVKVGMMTANFFGILGTNPQLGRFFVPGEEGPGAPFVAVISDGLWHRRFGADPHMLGRAVRLNGKLTTIVGVMPPGFKIIFPEGSSVPPEMDAFVPFRSQLATDPPDQSYLRIIGRLRVGVTIPQAQQELETIAAHLRSKFSAFVEPPLGLQIVPLQGDLVRNIRPALLALFGGAGLVLLIACANVANLLLSRANERTREITLRIAIGAARGRLIRQLLTESVLLFCCGAVAAISFGWGALRLLLAMQPKEMERLSAIQMDASVFAFTFAVAIAGGLLFGLAPALGAGKVDLPRSLNAVRQTASPASRRHSNLLVSAEVALGFILLIGAGLMLQTFAKLLQVNPGFATANVLTFRVSVPWERYNTSASAVQFLRDLKANLSSIPGVEAVGITSHLPFDDTLPNWYSFFWPEGAPREQQNTLMADHRSILPGYFKSMGVTFLAGRDFDEHDVEHNLHVAIIDDVVAQQSWPGQQAVGKLLNIENGNFVRDTAQVIGVVKHLQYHTLTDQVRGQIYILYPLAIRTHMAVTLKSNLSTQALLLLIRQKVTALDKDLPIYHVASMADYVDSARKQTRFVTLLAGVMAAIALLLACTGIYAVTTYSVVQRTSELGIRIALGAQSGELFALVLRQSMLPVALGISAGFILSFLLTPLLSSLLFGVHPTDAPTHIAVALLLSSSALIASFLPARRTMRVDPTVALRYE
jgi:putative ABC transport system permease protein